MFEPTTVTCLLRTKEGGGMPLSARSKSKSKVLLLVDMAGLGLFNQKSARALAPRGLLKSVYDFLCLKSTQKVSGHRENSQGSFYLRPELHAKKRVLDPQGGFGYIVFYTKPSPKHQNLTSVG